MAQAAFRLDGKSALITGAATGLGAQIAISLAVSGVDWERPVLSFRLRYFRNEGGFDQHSRLESHSVSPAVGWMSAEVLPVNLIDLGDVAQNVLQVEAAGDNRGFIDPGERQHLIELAKDFAQFGAGSA